MQTLTEFKRVIAEPNTTLTLVASSMANHRFMNLERKVSKAQTNAVALESFANGGNSWLYYGKASEWAFNTTPVGIIATNTSADGTYLAYLVGKAN